MLAESLDRRPETPTTFLPTFDVVDSNTAEIGLTLHFFSIDKKKYLSGTRIDTMH